MELCVVATDQEPFSTAVVPFRIQKLNGDGHWSTWPPHLHLACEAERTIPVRLWPFQSVFTPKGAIAAIDGYRKGDRIRFAAPTKYDNRPHGQREFASPPLLLWEEREFSMGSHP